MKARAPKLLLSLLVVVVSFGCTPESPGGVTTTTASTTTTTSGPLCTWYTYSGAELTTGVMAQIGQIVNGQSYVAGVGYSERPDGSKYNIRYGMEDGTTIAEVDVFSVEGTPGFYSIDGTPIMITGAPAYCPPYPL